MASLELSSDKGGSSLGSAGVSESKADICDGSGGGSSGGGSPADGFCDASASAEIDAAVDDSNDDVVGNGSASGGAAADAAVAQEFTASSGSGGRGGGDFEGGGLGAAGDDGPPMFPAVGDNHTPSKQIFLSHGQADSQDQCYGIALEIGPKDVWYDMTEEEITKPAMEKVSLALKCDAASSAPFLIFFAFVPFHSFSQGHRGIQRIRALLKFQNRLKRLGQVRTGDGDV